MNLELGKEYIVTVTDKGIVPIDEFDRERFYDKDNDDLDFLTDEEKTIIENQAYQKGLNDSWECARKIVQTSRGYSHDEIKEIYGTRLRAFDLTPSEAIAKIKEYEEIKEYEDKCKECKWDEFRDAQSPVGTPCDSCFEGKNFSPKVARCCSILNDTCPYDIPCAECEVHCSIERAKQKLKGDKE